LFGAVTKSAKTTLIQGGNIADTVVFRGENERRICESHGRIRVGGHQSLAGTQSLDTETAPDLQT